MRSDEAVPARAAVQGAFACAWCHSINSAVTADWCSCVSAKPSLTCESCGRCFCKATVDWKLAFFTSSAAAVYRERTGKLQRAFKSSSAAQANGLARPVILVVDDDKIVHVVAKRVLAEFGGTVLHATDGQAAFELAEQTLPDLVITDALLPKLDGRELSLLLKTNDATRHCKVAVITALYKGIRYRSEAAQRYLVDAYAEKPVTATTLRKIATELLPDHASFVVAEPAGETTAAGALQ